MNDTRKHLKHKPLTSNPKAVNYAEIGRSTNFSREYVRRIVLGLGGSPEAIALVKKAMKRHLRIN